MYIVYMYNVHKVVFKTFSATELTNKDKFH